jgi:hypothetical protein
VEVEIRAERGIIDLDPKAVHPRSRRVRYVDRERRETGVVFTDRQIIEEDPAQIRDGIALEGREIGRLGQFEVSFVDRGAVELEETLRFP